MMDDVVVSSGVMVPVSQELLDDVAPRFNEHLRRLMLTHLDDEIFFMQVRRSRWNPSPLPVFRLFRWLPTGV